MKLQTAPSEFINLKGIEYFTFEEDFMENNIRCIPMIVRFKMDLAGIKLKLGEWSRFQPSERIELALRPVNNRLQISTYREYLAQLVVTHTGKAATAMLIDEHPQWKDLFGLPPMLREKFAELKLSISISQWQRLTNIQRFALLKLCRPGHENKNFPKAVAEFGLLNT